MKRSVDRILTTHTGSLPRPEKLVELMFAKEEGRECISLLCFVPLDMVNYRS